MKRRIGISMLLLVVLLASRMPVRGQANDATHHYLPFVASGQMLATASTVYDNRSTSRSTQATGLTLTVTKFTDSADGVCDIDCSLREAVSVANQTPGADTISLAGGVYQLTIPPELDPYGMPREDENNAIGDLALADDLTLLGAGAEMTTVASAMRQRAFKVLANAKVQFHHFTITGGATENNEAGGGLFNAGALTMNHVRVVDIQIGNSDAASGNGGGIYNIGTLALFDTTIANNHAYDNGGGMVNTGVLTMTNVQVTDNEAGGYDGGGNGGGIYNTGTVAIYRSQIIRNVANPFGAAAGTGGGISNEGVLNVYDSVLQDNRADGGESQTRGGGVSNNGDALISGSTVAANMAELGGGIAVFGGAVRVVNSSVSGNQGSIGGGLWNSGGADVTLLNSTISQNIVSGDGGGLYSNDAGSRVSLQNSTVSENQSTNGGSGGGLWNSGSSAMTLLNTTVSGNRSSYNGGGINNTRDAGLFTILNSTIADNQAEGNGGGIWNDENSTLTYRNTIIAGNRAAGNGPDCQNEAILTSQGHNLVGSGTGCDSSAIGDVTVAPNTVFLHTIQPLAVHEPGQTATHALLPGSPAVDTGDDTVCPASDQRGVVRPQGSHCDIGAFEIEMVTNSHLFVSSSSHAKAGGVSFRDEDILAYDLTHHTWQMFFDGSDVGIAKDVDAFSLLPDGTLLLSFNTSVKAPGLGKVDDSDIVRFTPTTLGNTTAGIFAWYLRGADVGLTTDGEDIDLIDFSRDGQLIVSTMGDFKTPTVSGQDEDLIQLNNAIVGIPSGGDWSLSLDGSRVGLANEDLNGLWRDPATNELYLTVKDTFALAETRIDSDDIFICTPSGSGAETTCAYRLFWNGDEHDYGSENIESIALGVLPISFAGSVQASTVESPTPEELAPDNDLDDLNLEELIYRLYLPVIQQ